MSFENRIRQIAPENITPTENVAGAETKIAEIKETMRKHGWFDEPAYAIRDAVDDKIYLLDGHHRFAAAQELGIKEIPVVLLKFEELPGVFLYYNSFADIRRAAQKARS